METSLHAYGLPVSFFGDEGTRISLWGDRDLYGSMGSIRLYSRCRGTISCRQALAETPSLGRHTGRGKHLMNY